MIYLTQSVASITLTIGDLTINKANPSYVMQVTDLYSNESFTFSLVENPKTAYYSTFTISGEDVGLYPAEFKYEIIESGFNKVETGILIYYTASRWIDSNNNKSYTSENIIKGYKS